jgi:DMSO/TMAO reductase YedYZ molybdopterin-dependent catalytic subunit
LRGPWLTSVFGAVLLGGIPVLFLTGLASYAAYNPRLPGNDPNPGAGWLRFYLFGWPTSPSWLYRVTQGTHVLLGLTLTPIVLAKLWSVLPKLFEWPPVRSLAHALERASLALLVGGAVFELVTGILNISNFYPWHFSFYDAHLYGAWVFIAAFTVHVGLKLPVMLRALRGRSLRRELGTPLADTRPEPPDPDGLVAAEPAAATVSRRGVLAGVGLGSFALLGLSVGQVLNGSWRRTALLAPRGAPYGDGPNDFQVNRTAATAGVIALARADGWRLEVAGPAGPRRLSRTELAALPLHTETLPIACVEGWSVSQSWTGVRLVDLAALAGATGADQVLVESLERNGAFAHATLSRGQLTDPRSLLALRVNGADLSLDHGFPARVIVPAAPGVHNTKWVARMTFQ